MSTVPTETYLQNISPLCTPYARKTLTIIARNKSFTVPGVAQREIGVSASFAEKFFLSLRKGVR